MDVKVFMQITMPAKQFWLVVISSNVMFLDPIKFETSLFSVNLYHNLKMCIKVASTNLMCICRGHRLLHPENLSILKKVVSRASYCKRPSNH